MYGPGEDKLNQAGEESFQYLRCCRAQERLEWCRVQPQREKQSQWARIAGVESAGKEEAFCNGRCSKRTETPSDTGSVCAETG